MLPKSVNILPSSLTYREKPKVPCIWKLQTDSFMLNHMNITTVTF